MNPTQFYLILLVSIQSYCSFHELLFNLYSKIEPPVKKAQLERPKTCFSLPVKVLKVTSAISWWISPGAESTAPAMAKPPACTNLWSIRKMHIEVQMIDT